MELRLNIMCSGLFGAPCQACVVVVAWILSFKDNAKVGDMWPGYSYSVMEKLPGQGWERIRQRSENDGYYKLLEGALTWVFGIDNISCYGVFQCFFRCCYNDQGAWNIHCIAGCRLLLFTQRCGRFCSSGWDNAVFSSALVQQCKMHHHKKNNPERSIHIH